MIVERLIDGYWQARGKGPLRPIITEAETRIVAMQRFGLAIREQRRQLEAANKGESQ